MRSAFRDLLREEGMQNSVSNSTLGDGAKGNGTTRNGLNQSNELKRKREQDDATEVQLSGQQARGSNSLPPTPMKSELSQRKIRRNLSRLHSPLRTDVKGNPVGGKHFLQQNKIINDAVHGVMEFEPLCMRIIDTPQFQRLRGLKQLGACSYVYPTASHNRFVHSLGVAHLAQVFVENLRKMQPYLNITPTDMLCVKLAGLCHDLGHGPFSHLYDGPFLRAANPGCDWTHEQGSIDLFDYMLKDNQIELEEYGLGFRDVTFIKEMIMGRGSGPGGSRIGRLPEENKEFLYDIINNTLSGLDVDKLDYFKRDAKMGGIRTNNDFMLLMMSARVAKDIADPLHPLRICFPEKLVGKVMEVFKTRFTLHHTMYTHKTVVAIEHMIVDVLKIANEHYFLPGKVLEDGSTRFVKIAEAFTDMAAYSRLTDSILDFIEMTTDPALHPARELLKRIKIRDIYRCCGKTNLKNLDSHECGAELCPDWCSGRNGKIKSMEALAEDIVSHADPEMTPLSPSDLVVEIYCIHHGKKGEDPVEKVRFYRKEGTFEEGCVPVAKEHYQEHAPSVFMEKNLRVFVRQTDLLASARQAFNNWCRNSQSSSPFPSLSQDSVVNHNDDDDWS